MRWSLFYIFLNSLYQEVVPCCITHVWIITRQSKDAYETKLDFMERGWLQVHFRGRNEGLHKNMGVVQWFGRAHFFKGLFARKYAAHTHTHKKFNSCLKSSILKITGFLLMLSCFMWNFHPKKSSHVTITYHRSVGRSWMPKKQSIDPFPGI